MELLEKYKDNLIDREFRRLARNESSGWEDVLALFSLFPILIVSIYFYSPFIVYQAENDTSGGWLLIGSLFAFSLMVMAIWSPLLFWSLKRQSKKAEAAYHRLRAEYGLEPKEY